MVVQRGLLVWCLGPQRAPRPVPWRVWKGNYGHERATYPPNGWCAKDSQILILDGLKVKCVIEWGPADGLRGYDASGVDGKGRLRGGQIEGVGESEGGEGGIYDVLH